MVSAQWFRDVKGARDRAISNGDRAVLATHPAFGRFPPLMLSPSLLPSRASLAFPFPVFPLWSFFSPLPSQGASPITLCVWFSPPGTGRVRRQAAGLMAQPWPWDLEGEGGVYS